MLRFRIFLAEVGHLKEQCHEKSIAFHYFPQREIDTLFTYAQFKKPIFDTNKKKYFGALNNFQMGFDSVADPPKVKVAVKTAF